MELQTHITIIREEADIEQTMLNDDGTKREVGKSPRMITVGKWVDLELATFYTSTDFKAENLVGKKVKIIIEED